MKTTEQNFIAYVDEIDGQPEVWKAVYTNNHRWLKRLIDKGYDINAPSTHGKFTDSTPFWLACNLNNYASMSILLDAGANVNSSPTDNVGKTPVWYYAYYDYPVKQLIDANADVNVVTLSGEHTGTSPLLFAALNNHRENVSDLILANANVNVKAIYGPDTGKTPLWWAARHGCRYSIIELINAGADINATAEAGEYAGTSVLWWVSYHGIIDIAVQLIDKNADINVKANAGEHQDTTILWLLLRLNYEDEDQLCKLRSCIKKVISLEPNLHIVPHNSKGDSLLSLTCEHIINDFNIDPDNDLENFGYILLKAFINAGINIDSTFGCDNIGEVTLFWDATFNLISNFNKSFYDLLLEASPDVNFFPTQGIYAGKTTLWLAIERNDEDLVQQLIKHNANVNHINNYELCSNVSVLDLAKRLELDRISQILLQAGAKQVDNTTLQINNWWKIYNRSKLDFYDANYRDQDGVSLLWLAIYANNYGMIHKLVNNPDVDVNATPFSGKYKDRSPFWMLCKHKQLSRYHKKLLDAGADINVTVSEGPEAGISAFWNLIDNLEEQPYTTGFADTSDSLKFIIRALEKVNDINATPINGENAGKTALWVAINKGKYKFALQLIKAGAQVSTSPQNGIDTGKSILWLILHRLHVYKDLTCAPDILLSLALELVTRDADLRATAKTGNEAGKSIFWLTMSIYTQTNFKLNFLLKKLISENIYDDTPNDHYDYLGVTGLWFAAYGLTQKHRIYANEELEDLSILIEKLINFGANVNVANQRPTLAKKLIYFRTPLWMISEAINTYYYLAISLINAGADPNIFPEFCDDKNTYSRPATILWNIVKYFTLDLDPILKSNFDILVEKIIRSKPDLDFSPPAYYGQTILYNSIKNENHVLALKLIHYGASTNIFPVDQYGWWIHPISLCFSDSNVNLELITELANKINVAIANKTASTFILKILSSYLSPEQKLEYCNTLIRKGLNVNASDLSSSILKAIASKAKHSEASPNLWLNLFQIVCFEMLPCSYVLRRNEFKSLNDNMFEIYNFLSTVSNELFRIFTFDLMAPPEADVCYLDILPADLQMSIAKKWLRERLSCGATIDINSFMEMSGILFKNMILNSTDRISPLVVGNKDRRPEVIFANIISRLRNNTNIIDDNRREEMLQSKQKTNRALYVDHFLPTYKQIMQTRRGFSTTERKLIYSTSETLSIDPSEKSKLNSTTFMRLLKL